MNSTNQSKATRLDNTSKVIILFLILRPISNLLVGMTVNYINNDFLFANWGFICMYCPGIAGIIASRFNKNPSLGLGLKRCPAKYIIVAIIIPIFYLFLSFGIYWAIFPENLLLDFNFTKMLPIMLPINIFFAFGEEIGWRGCLSPAMTEKFGYAKASILVGIIWGVWHNPSSLNRIYYPGAAYVFILSTIAISFIMSYLRLKSKSVWPAVMIHGIHNFTEVDILDSITVGAQKAYWVGNTGIITVAIIFLIVIGVLYVYKSQKIPADLIS